MPVLIIVGKEDEITPPDVALLMHEKIKGSIIHIIDHAGHLSNMENSREFNNQLSGFLSLIKHVKYGKEKINNCKRQTIHRVR